jgi:hypothetical protein
MARGTRPSSWQAAASVVAATYNRLLACLMAWERQHRSKLASDHLLGDFSDLP